METTKRKYQITFIKETTEIIEAESLNEACAIAEKKAAVKQKREHCPIIVKSVIPISL